MRDEHKIALIGISLIAILELVALSNGIDGIMFSAATGAIGAICGYAYKSLKTKKM